MVYYLINPPKYLNIFIYAILCESRDAIPHKLHDLRSNQNHRGFILGPLSLSPCL